MTDIQQPRVVTDDEWAQIRAWDTAQDRLGKYMIIATLIGVVGLLAIMLLVPLLPLAGGWRILLGFGIFIVMVTVLMLIVLPVSRARNAAFNAWTKERYGITFGDGQITELLLKKNIVTTYGTRWAYSGDRFSHEISSVLAEPPHLVRID